MKLSCQIFVVMLVVNVGAVLYLYRVAYFKSGQTTGELAEQPTRPGEKQTGCVELYTYLRYPSDNDKHTICPESGPGESCEHDDFLLSPRYIRHGHGPMSTCQFTCVAKGDLSVEGNSVHRSLGREFVWAYQVEHDSDRLWWSVIYDLDGYVVNNNHLSFECRFSIRPAKKN
eukprot:895379_1